MAQKITPRDMGLRNVRPIMARFEELFPSCIDCGDLADGLDNRCSKCASDKEWNERRASARREPVGI